MPIYIYGHFYSYSKLWRQLYRLSTLNNKILWESDMLLKFLTFLIFLTCAQFALAMPKITVTKNLDNKGFTKIRVYNQTRVTLACYVSIDGHKSRFVLLGRSNSSWYTATSKKFSHTDFKTWCDYLKYHPSYEAYRKK